MKNISLEIKFKVADSLSELSEERKSLVNKAWQASERAYAPYSEFKVGAAILFEDGSILEGNNQENAAYPSGMCAERVALFYAKSRFPNKKIKEIAIVADTMINSGEPVPPCGGCRQVMIEVEDFQKMDIPVLLAGKNGRVFLIERMKDLLPFSFLPSNLKNN